MNLCDILKTDSEHLVQKVIPYAQSRLHFPCIVQEKYDGVYCIAWRDRVEKRCHIFSRTGEEYLSMKHLQNMLYDVLDVADKDLLIFEAYIDNPGTFTNSIIELGASALELQENGFLAIRRKEQRNYYSTEILAIDEYWKAFVETYLGTPYLPEADTKLTGEAITILDWLYEKDEMKDSPLLDTILRKADKPTIVSYLHKMMNEHFVNSDISKQRFLYFGKLLPILSADIDSNSARGLMQHFIKPI